MLLQIFYMVRSERMLMEQVNYNLLFPWFVGLELDEPIWNHALFSKNSDRLLNQEVEQEFFRHVLAEAKPHLCDEHFTVDGTLIESWASQKSFQTNDGGDDNPRQFRGAKRSNETHESKTDPEARLYRKRNGQEAKLGYLGHVLMENRHGLILKCDGDRGRQHRRTRCGTADAVQTMAQPAPTAACSADERRGGQGLRHARFCRDRPRDDYSAARDAKSQPAWMQRH